MRDGQRGSAHRDLVHQEDLAWSYHDFPCGDALLLAPRDPAADVRADDRVSADLRQGAVYWISHVGREQRQFRDCAVLSKRQARAMKAAIRLRPVPHWARIPETL